MQIEVVRQRRTYAGLAAVCRADIGVRDMEMRVANRWLHRPSLPRSRMGFVASLLPGRCTSGPLAESVSQGRRDLR